MLFANELEFLFCLSVVVNLLMLIGLAKYHQTGKMWKNAYYFELNKAENWYNAYCRSAHLAAQYFKELEVQKCRFLPSEESEDIDAALDACESKADAEECPTSPSSASENSKS